MTKTEVAKLLVVLRESFRELFGDQFDRMLLFGSHVRGDAQADSDIDVLVVLRDEFGYGKAIALTSELIARLSLENDLLISTVFISTKRYESGGSPFLLNVRREGMQV